MPLNVMSASDMGIGEAGLTAIFGYVVVFVGLLLLMVVLYIMGAVFKSGRTRKRSTEGCGTGCCSGRSTGS